VGMERGLLSLLSTIEELLGRKSRGSDLEIREYGRRNVMLTMWHPPSVKVGTTFADKWRSLGRHSSLVDSGHGVTSISPANHSTDCSALIIMHHPGLVQ
jgi:hypothetical protein